MFFGRGLLYNRLMTSKIEQIFFKIFSEKNLKTFERVILFFATGGFIVHLLLILLNNNGVIDVGENILLQNPISAIYTPFSFILVYEAFLLIYYLPRSFTTSVAKQYEIISLILIRKIFKDIPEVDLNENWISNENNIQLIYDLIGILIDPGRPAPDASDAAAKAAGKCSSGFRQPSGRGALMAAISSPCPASRCAAALQSVP